MCKSIRFLAFLLLAFQLIGCEKMSITRVPVTAKVSVTPSGGLTTSVFQFDMTKSVNPNAGDKRLFYRFDWESDGTWDNAFTDESIRAHRFYKPGTYLIRVEALDLHGQTDTTSVRIKIDQGYSKPRPQFKILPPKGNIMVDFVFDASATKDDEDSLNTLKFRWDWEGDRTWDTPWLNSGVISHRYPVEGSYYVNLEVEDPANYRNQVSVLLNVNLISDSIIPDFITIPAFITQREEAVFDASGSVDLSPRSGKLQYRWDWENDGVFDTEWVDEPVVTHTYMVEQIFSVRLEVRNSLGLKNSIIKKLDINHKNLPPKAFFVTSSPGGNTRSSIRFDAWSSSDLETIPSQLLMRWDFDADGIFDTEFAKGPEMYHTFSKPGEFAVRLEIMDEGGLTATCSQMMYISEGTARTDILLDKRGVAYEYYGITEVGGQWWFAKNLKVARDDLYKQVSYQSDEKYPNYFGCLYLRKVLDTACPQGWRVPSREDWDILFSHFPADSLYECLKLGGRSDINLVFGGMGFPFSGIHNYGFYWSSTRQNEPTSLSSWYITIDKVKSRVLKGFGGNGSEVMSIRCMKDR